MANVHHAVLKKATANDMTVEYDSDRGQFKAYWNADASVIAFHSSASDALSLAIAIRINVREYPGLSVVQDGGFFVVKQGDEEIGAAEDPHEAFAEAFDNYDVTKNTEQDDDDEVRPHSIVPRRFKDEWKTRGDASNCGDWVAVQLKFYAHDAPVGRKKKSTPNIEAYKAIAIANGVADPNKWNVTSAGKLSNNGQIAMNNSNAIRRQVFLTGKMELPASVTNGGGHITLTPTEDELATLKVRVSKWICLVLDRNGK